MSSGSLASGPERRILSVSILLSRAGMQRCRYAGVEAEAVEG